MEKLFSNFRKGVWSQATGFLTFLFLSFTPLFAQTTWTCATNSAPWTTRSCFGSVVFDDKMWVIRGTMDANDIKLSFQ